MTLEMKTKIDEISSRELSTNKSLFKFGDIMNCKKESEGTKHLTRSRNPNKHIIGLKL